MSDRSIFDNLTPRFAFWAGVVVTVAVVSLVGCIILLGVVLGGGAASARAVATNPSPSPSAPADDGAPRDIVIPAVSSADHIRGAKNGKVVMVEYSDLECPFCKQFHNTLKELITTYPNDVKWVYRNFPLDQLHPKARAEAEAVECAGDQGKYWEMLDKVFEVTPSNNGLNLDDLPKLAQEVGVKNIAKFNECRTSGKFREKIQKQIDEAVAAGGRGTPYTVVLAGDQKIPLDGAYGIDQLKQIVEQFKK